MINEPMRRPSPVMTLPPWARLGIIGGLAFLLVAAFTVSMQLLGPTAVLATTCEIPNIFVFNQVPSAADFNDNWAAACTVLNGQITNDNIATNASIVWSKLVPIDDPVNGSTQFKDHSARHENGGADEIEDLEILETGTLVSLHASRHASGGADPLTSGSITLSMLDTALQNSLGGSAAHVVDLATARDQVFVGDVRTRFKTTGLTADAGVDLIYCNAQLYVAVNDTSTGLDYVLKLNKEAMTQTSSISLTAEDNPADLECHPDGSVYVLTAGNAGARNPSLLKIATNDGVTTLEDLEASDSVDAVVTSVIETSGVAIFTLGQDNTMTNDRIIYRTVAATGDTTKLTYDIDTDVDGRDLVMWKWDGTERVAILWAENAGSAECCIRSCDPANLGSCDIDQSSNCLDTGDIRINVGGADCGAPLIFDGDTFISTTSTGGNLYSVGRQFLDASFVFGSTVVATANTGYFDGHYRIWQEGDGEISLWPAGNGNISQNNPWKAGQANQVACGVTSDGTYLYVCWYNSAGTELTVVKTLL